LLDAQLVRGQHQFRLQGRFIRVVDAGETLELAGTRFLVKPLGVALLRFRPSGREIVMALFTVMVVSALVYTLTGFLFRGPGFKLYWPWNMPEGYNPFDSL